MKDKTMSGQGKNLEEAKQYTLGAESELRFEVEEKDAKVNVYLISGFAEIFGTELVKKQKYEFGAGAKIAVFSYQGCVLSVSGKTEVIYLSQETPMIQYLNCHAALEQMRIVAEKNDERGPIVIVVGPMDVGKSTLCRIFLNYAVRNGRRPLYLDVDIGQGAISIPGTIASLLIERPANVEEGFSQTAPIVYHFGYKTPSGNHELYNVIISKMAQVSLQSMDMHKRTKHSGIVINTCGWVKDGGYKHLLHLSKVFQVDAIFVIDKERLYNELLRDLPSSARIVLLPKSRGVVERSKTARQEARDQRIKEYFYGNHTPLYPFSFELNFQELKLYKIGAPSLPDSCMPIGMKANDNKTKLMPVTPSPSLLHHILTVTFADTINSDVIGTNAAGFICVTNVDMERQTITVLSPQPRPLPNTVLLLSELQFMDSHA